MNIFKVMQEQRKKLAAINYLYLMAGISEPTEIQEQLAIEAITIANIDKYMEKPITCKDLCNKEEFEIRSLSYFMQKINHGNVEAIQQFRKNERRKLAILHENSSHLSKLKKSKYIVGIDPY